MDDDAKQIEKKTEFKQGSGSILAAARKQQQKTIEEIAGELNLSVTQVKTIELDQSDGLPEPTYVRGYIRGYSKLLGLNPEEVLQNYLNPNWQQSSSLNDIPRGIGNAEEDHGGLFTVGKVVTLLIIVGGIFFAWYTGLVAELLPTNSEPQESVIESTPLDAVDGENGSNNIAQSLALEQSSGDVENSAGSSDDAESAANLQNGGALNKLLLTFSETSWVDIRNENDERLAYKSYVQGEELRVENESVLSVFIGNAAGVSVELNGEPFDINPHREGVYAKFVINE